MVGNIKDMQKEIIIKQYIPKIPGVKMVPRVARIAKTEKNISRVPEYT